MFRVLRGQTVEGGNESEGRVWTRKLMAFHQIPGQKKVADRRQKGGEQNANGGLALGEEIAHGIKRKGGGPARPGIAKFEKNRRARDWHHRTHLPGCDAAPP